MVEGGRGRGGVVVVTPFCEVVCKFEAGDIGRGIFEVDDY